MKKAVIIFLILGIIGFYSYSRFDKFMRVQGFETDIEAVLQMGTPNEEMIKSLIQQKASKRGAIINPEDIFISVEDTEEKTMAGAIVGMAGVKVETKKLIIKFPYAISSLGLSKTYNFERSRLFTVSASLPEPVIPQ